MSLVDKEIFRDTLKGAAVTSPDELVLKPVRSGRVVKITNVVVVDKTNTCTNVHLIIRRTGVDFYVWSMADTVAGDYYPTPNHFYLTEGELLVVQFVGATALDVLEAYIEGYFKDKRSS